MAVSSSSLWGSNLISSAPKSVYARFGFDITAPSQINFEIVLSVDYSLRSNIFVQVYIWLLGVLFSNGLSSNYFAE